MHFKCLRRQRLGGAVVEEDNLERQGEEGAEPSGCCLKPYVKQVEEDVLIHCEECDLKQSHDKELYGAAFAQDGPKGNADRAHAEISIDQAGKGEGKMWFNKEILFCNSPSPAPSSSNPTQR